MTIAMNPPSARHRPACAAGRAVAGAERGERRVQARYRRRRAVAGLLVAVTVGAAAMVADSVLTGPGGVPASAAGAGTAPQGHGRVVRAAAGDSLWSIATTHRGGVPITRYVDKLISLNGGTTIEVGQFVRLP